MRDPLNGTKRFPLSYASKHTGLVLRCLDWLDSLCFRNNKDYEDTNKTQGLTKGTQSFEFVKMFFCTKLVLWETEKPLLHSYGQFWGFASILFLGEADLTNSFPNLLPLH